MLVGILKLKFRLHAVFSLKEKRKIAQSIKQKLKNKYNLSIAEIGAQDSLDFLELGIAVVSNSSQQVESMLNKIQDSAQAMTSEELIAISSEVFGV